MTDISRTNQELNEENFFLKQRIREQEQAESGRQQAVEALRSSEEKYRELVENANSIILRRDVTGKITFFNEYASRFLGFSRDEIIGRNVVGTIVPANDSAGKDLTQMIQNISIHPEQYKNNENENICRDGTRVWVAWTNKPILDDQGRCVEILCIGNDITKRKRAEAENRILTERLQHADKMEAIGTLAGGIAHDFNNLLMGIQGYASLSLMNLDPSHPNYERLKRIEEQVQSGADLTRQLLGFARGGRYEVKPADMNDVLEKSSVMFGRTKKEISIHRKLGKDLWIVEVDRGQMEQVFMNLYVNAWQAMPGGGVIYLETEKIILDDEQARSYTVKPGRYVKISMTDTGTGMDAKTRERIFDPFFTTKEMGRGTGLGLATVYGIIKGHGGIINVYSEPGHGTTFNIYLPASEKEMVKEKTVTGTIARGTETILLVDDEKMVLEVNTELLEAMGYRVYAAGNGQEAIAVYMEKKNDIDLVVLDMIMPGISGGETFDRLREINPGVKVLLSSGYSITGQAQEILDRGCNGFLQKPFHPEKFSSKVREMLD
ncbi:MAG: PAS domain S-box protein [Syntrophales bacterium]